MFFLLLTVVKMKECIYKIQIAPEENEDDVAHEFFVDSIGSPYEKCGIHITFYSVNPWDLKTGVFIKKFTLIVTQEDKCGEKDGKKIYSKKLLMPELCWNVYIRDKFFCIIFYNPCCGRSKRNGLFYCSESSLCESFDVPFEDNGKIKGYIVDRISGRFKDYSVIEKCDRENMFRSHDKTINKIFSEFMVRLAVACKAKKMGVEDNDEFRASLGFKSSEFPFREASTVRSIFRRCVFA